MDMEILDFHTHIGDVINGTDILPPDKPSKGIEFIFQKIGYRSLFGGLPSFLRTPLAIEIQRRHTYGSVENLIKSMQKNKVSRCIVLPIEPYTQTEWVIEKIGDKKDIMFFASVCPSDVNWREKLSRYLSLGCKGLKLHPILQRTPPEDKTYFQIIEEYRGFKKPVIFHTGEVEYLVFKTKYSEFGKVKRFIPIIKAFPDVNFVLAHSGLFEVQDAIEIAEDNKNVYLETSLQPLKSILKAINKLGSRRLLFGSDWPSSFQEAPVKIFKKVVRRKREDAERIGFKNAFELLDIK